MRRTILATATLLACIHSAGATVPEYPYHHFATNHSELGFLAVPEGAYFHVKIDQTCRPEFSARFTGIEKSKEPEPAPQPLASERGGVTLQSFGIDCVVSDEPLILEIPNNPKFGGYQVDLSTSGKHNPTALLLSGSVKREQLLSTLVKKYQEANKACPNLNETECWGQHPADADAIAAAVKAVGQTKALENVSITIAIREWAWQYEFAGGFTGSKLTDPQFASKPCDDDASKQCAFRDTGKESNVRLGFAGFVHMSHTKLPELALSFGLGINDTTGVSFFFGPSWRLGGKGFVTLGVNLGQVSRLPNGVEVGKPITDPNVLNNPGQRTATAFFAGISYSFIGGGKEALEKPFQAPPDKPPGR